MPKSKKNPPISALSKWENAGEKLAVALSAYLQSCISLTTFYGAQNPVATDIYSQVDKSLNTLHTKLSSELSQSRVVLAQMRNRILSRSYLLPDEVLAEIFKHVVYTPGPDDRRNPSMIDGLKRIFGRLHSLLGVCSTWRNIGIGLSELWSIIPAADLKSGCPKTSTTLLAIERSQAFTPNNRHLRLAVVLSDQISPCPPFAKDNLPHFDSISIEAQLNSQNFNTSNLLGRLVESQSPSVLTELSIHRCQDDWDDSPPRLPKRYDYLCSYISTENLVQFTRLIGSLSTLQLRSAHLHWNTITFSDKFVTIHLQSVVLGNHSKLNDLLSALQSAPELRDVKLVSVVAFKGNWTSNIAQVKVSPAKLQSLLLDDLSFNVLEHVLTSISPGSHRLKVGLTPKSYSVHHSEEDMESHADDPMGLLRRSNIDTLFLDLRERESPWVDSEELQGLLKSLPCLKNLIMSEWQWELGAILALERPRSSSSFPNLTGLCILDGYIADTELLPQVIASYSLQNLILDSHPTFLIRSNRDQILHCLKTMVPDFQLVRGMEQMDEFNYFTWRFW